jgi:hypothetical protein
MKSSQSLAILICYSSTVQLATASHDAAKQSPNYYSEAYSHSAKGRIPESYVNKYDRIARDGVENFKYPEVQSKFHSSRLVSRSSSFHRKEPVHDNNFEMPAKFLVDEKYSVQDNTKDPLKQVIAH